MGRHDGVDGEPSKIFGRNHPIQPRFVQVMGGASPDGFQYMTMRSCQSSGGEQSTGAEPSKTIFTSSLDSKNSGSKSQK